MKYLNENGDELYILHFPGKKDLSMYNHFIEPNLNREIKIANNLSIISINNQQCWDDSFLKHQSELNNFKVYNTGLDIIDWKNTCKITETLKCLEEIDTEYALIMDGRDTIIVNDLDDNFIQNYLKLGYPIVYSGIKHGRKIEIDNQEFFDNIIGPYKYLNSGGGGIGKTQDLLNIYTQANNLIEQKNETNTTNSDEYILRYLERDFPNIIKVDSEAKLFRNIVHYDFKYIRKDGNIII